MVWGYRRTSSTVLMKAVFAAKEWGQHQGAGLDITKKIIFKHNGKMKVESGGINTFAKFALTFTP